MSLDETAKKRNYYYKRNSLKDLSVQKLLNRTETLGDAISDELQKHDDILKAKRLDHNTDLLPKPNLTLARRYFAWQKAAFAELSTRNIYEAPEKEEPSNDNFPSYLTRRLEEE